MRVLFTGISCAGRKELVEELEQVYEEQGREVRTFEIGALIAEFVEHAGGQLSPERYFDTDPVRLNLAMDHAVDVISRDTQEHNVTYLIHGHACFRWKGLLREGTTISAVQRIAPDKIITVVDDYIDIHARMQETEQWSGTREEEVNIWMDEEAFITKSWANYFQKPFMMIPKRLPPADLFSAIENHKPCFYLSYPITKVGYDELQDIETFRRDAAPDFLVLDPLYIKDLERASNAAEAKEEQGSIADVRDGVLRLAEARTITRDVQFIDQSDFVVVLYLTDKVSAGVLYEMNHASTQTKPVYAVHEGKISPFFSHLCTEVFETTDELKKFLDEEYTSRQ